MQDYLHNRVRKVEQELNRRTGYPASKVRMLSNMIGLPGRIAEMTHGLLLSRIYYRTLDYSKLFEKITDHEFAEVGEVGHSSSSITRKLPRMEQEGLITVCRLRAGRRKVGNLYCLRLDQILASIKFSVMPGHREDALRELEGIVRIAPRFKSFEIDCNREITVATMKELLEEARLKSERGKTKRATKAKNKAPGLMVRVDGVLTMLDVTTTNWTGKTRGMLKNLVKQDHGMNAEDAFTEIEKIFVEWKGLRRQLRTLPKKQRLELGMQPNFEELYKFRREIRNCLYAQAKAPKVTTKKVINLSEED